MPPTSCCLPLPPIQLRVQSVKVRSHRTRHRSPMIVKSLFIHQHRNQLIQPLLLLPHSSEHVSWCTAYTRFARHYHVGPFSTPLAYDIASHGSASTSHW